METIGTYRLVVALVATVLLVLASFNAKQVAAPAPAAGPIAAASAPTAR